jgi:GNAT superfamily N-acetyltransferase
MRWVAPAIMNPRIHAAASADMPAVRRVAASFGLLDKWPTRPDYLDCELEHGRLLVAEATADIAAAGDEGSADALIGFGGSLRRGEITHLGDLFVDPRFQSSGVGRAILNGLFDRPGPRVTFASADPRAVPLYIRYGMRPLAPLYYLSGPADDPARTVPRGPEPANPSTIDVSELAAADAAASG